MSNFNQEQYLDDSLGGICGQSRPADKIIIVDDGSTDNSVAVIKKWLNAHPAIIFIQNPVNFGLQKSIGRTLPLIKTKYMVWAASDDVLLPNFLEKSMALLEKHPNAGLCFSELATFTSDKNNYERFSQNPDVEHIYNLGDLPEFCPPKTVQRRMDQSYFAPSSNTVVVKMEDLRKVDNFIAELKWHSDWFAYNVVALRDGACVVPETLALIRVRSDSYSASGMRDRQGLIIVLEKLLDVLQQPKFHDIKSIFQKHPSFYSVWNRTIIRLFLRRPRWWRTAFTYTVWLIKEYKRGTKSSWFRIAAKCFSILMAQTKLSHIRFSLLFVTYKRYLEVTRQRDEMSSEISHWITEKEKQDARVKEVERTSQQRAERIIELEALYGHIDVLNAHVKEVERTSQQRAERIIELDAANVELEKLNKQHEHRAHKHVEHCTALENLISEQLGPYYLPQQQELCESDKTPSILINTMPKSGTYFIGELFAKSLKLQKMILGKQYFPGDNIYQPKLHEFTGGGYISQDHLDPSPFNLEMLKRYDQKVIIHVRDPRQATLSYLHFLGTEQFTSNKDFTKLLIYPTLPTNFFDLDLPGKIDWGIANWLPCLMTWTSGWVNASTENKNISFTTYETMVTSQQKFIKSVLQTFEIPETDFIQETVAKNNKIHFRKGKLDEWKSVFNEDQIQNANKLIDIRLAEKFDWSL